MKNRLLNFTAGIFLISVSLLLNPVFLAWVFSPDGRISGTASVTVIILLEAFLLFAGVFMVRFREAVPWKLVFFSLAVCAAMLLAFLAWDFHAAYKSLYVTENQETRIDVHVHDPELGWKPRPGALARHISKGIFDVQYEMDELGFKKIPHRESAVRNLYFFGDSFTFGAGVPNEETFPNILASRYLSERVNVYNGGVMGYGILQMYLRYLSVEDRIKKGDIVALTPITPDLKRGFETYFLVEGLLFDDPVNFRKRRYPRFRNGEVDFITFGSPRAVFEVLSSFAPVTSVLFEGIKNKLGWSAFDQSREILSVMKKRVEARGAHFVMAFLPMGNELLSDRYEVDLSGFDAISLLPYLPHEREAVSKLEIPDDNHPSAAGHQAIAAALARVFREQGLLGPEDLKGAAS